MRVSPLSSICQSLDLLYEIQRLYLLLDAIENVWHDDKSEHKLDKSYLFLSLFREKTEPMITEVMELLEEARKGYNQG